MNRLQLYAACFVTCSNRKGSHVVYAQPLAAFRQLCLAPATRAAFWHSYAVTGLLLFCGPVCWVRVREAGMIKCGCPAHRRLQAAFRS